jgi:hypothetical protein
MCLGGSAMPTYQPPKPREIEAGPESPNDKVNNQEVENINDRSQQEAARKRNRGTTASKQQRPSGPAAQSSKTDKAY